MAADIRKPTQRVLYYNLEGRPIPYRVRVSNRSKHLRLVIENGGQLWVVVPKGFDSGDLCRVLESKKGWLSKNLSLLSGPGGSGSPGQACPTEALYLGRRYPIRIRYGAVAGATLEYDGTAFRIILPFDRQEVERMANTVRALLEKWYRRQAAELFPARLSHYNRDWRLTYNGIRIKGQRTRWGSCSAKKNLNFNWRLLMAPLEVLDYVVVHELAHLMELNHSPKFWQLVQSRCPAYRQHRVWLRRHGPTLVL